MSITSVSSGTDMTSVELAVSMKTPNGSFEGSTSVEGVVDMSLAIDKLVLVEEDEEANEALLAGLNVMCSDFKRRTKALLMRFADTLIMFAGRLEGESITTIYRLQSEQSYDRSTISEPARSACGSTEDIVHAVTAAGADANKSISMSMKLLAVAFHRMKKVLTEPLR
jgi:hypothetical protein